MKAMRLLRGILRGKCAVSPLMAIVITILIVLAVGLAVAAMTMGWFKGAGTAQLEASQSSIYMDQSTGKGKMVIHIHNVGTATARIKSVNITAVESVQIYFATGDKVRLKAGTVIATAIDGTIIGSTPSVAVDSTGVLVLPSQSSVDLIWDVDKIDGSSGHTFVGVFNVGVTYRGTVWPPAGAGSTTDFTVRVEALVP
jgi:hypothetical protein